MQGYWILELGELARSEIAPFLSKLFEPYQSHPVDCVVLV